MDLQAAEKLAQACDELSNACRGATPSTTMTATAASINWQDILSKLPGILMLIAQILGGMTPPPDDSP